MKFYQTSTAFALIASASAHMILEYPVPYGNTTINSSPLAAADFPCKQRPGVYDVSAMNEWNAGETQTISFIGSAVHGGGSCQFSLTTDKEPTTESQWKVIHSVVGGCPSNVTGNLPDAPAGHGAATFPVTLPKDLPNGQYTFAWTWLNKVGNREFYMNCAPIKVGGGTEATAQDTSTFFSKLPDMFVINIPDTSCSNTADQDFAYPNPGDSVVTGASAKPGADTTGAGCASMTAMGAGAGSIGSPAQATGAVSSAPAESQQPVATGVAPVSSAAAATSNPGGVFAPGASSAAASSVAGGQPTSFSTLVATQTAGEAAPTGVAPSQPSGTGSTTSPASGCTPCNNDGAVVCIGSNQFGICNWGCAVAQDLASGMACSNGSISRRSDRRVPRAYHRRQSSEMI